MYYYFFIIRSFDLAKQASAVIEAENGKEAYKQIIEIIKTYNEEDKIADAKDGWRVVDFHKV